ncbi:ABC transporter transmembrane domain-containing protein [Streptomyces sp. NPDC057144]|uniref:ABC transporter transmembrane domain-containing protein n=1 Tax=unclassified Streptomyces TaxID=2593676 RepID=UPI0018D6A328|nr:ABC transporter ATP-binding protein [Streptomyces sp. HB-N217]MBH5133052.1 ABC transporter ATP-binding protein [Streptomyces sp. HB-N217]WSU01197.1 ABC transporter ATP-binding protein/permease [Streptomyces sp. NBC_01124]
MRIDAYADPGTPDRRGGWRYLAWLVRRQWPRCLAGAVLASVWMVLLAATPYLMARAVDHGLEPGDLGALAGWTGAMVAVGGVNAWLGMMRHRTMTKVRMDANFRTVKVVVAHATRLGAALRAQVGTGEVVTIGVGDVQTISGSLTAVGPGVGAVAAYATVGGLMLSVSPRLALVVLLGVPLLAVALGPLMGRLQGRETEYRERQSVLTARIGDLAGGLRVLNGLGGKGLVADAFRRDSGRLREQGYRVGAVTSWIQALGMGLPMLFLALVTWMGARLAAQGRISVGELVSVYGYVVALGWPVAFLIEMGHQLSRGVVAARRVVAFLRLEPAPDEGTREAPAEPSALHDPASGVRVLPGRLTALATSRPSDAAEILDRLGRYTPSDATWGDIPLADIPLGQIRSRILVAAPEADLFAGPLSNVIGALESDPRGAGNCATSHNSAADAEQRTGADEWAKLTAAIHTAAAEDIVRALPDALETPIEAQARNLSGGQRQRIRLARALHTDPEILLAAEPTSALDAHTEATVADRLKRARKGRTTVLAATSPLLLDRADVVHHLVDGKVAATGTHRELLDTEPGYRALVARDAEAEAAAGQAAEEGEPAR